MSVRLAGAGAIATALFFFAPNEALANGRFPTAGLVAFDPRDAGHFVVRTTFGLFESRDRGTTFDYVCESALRLAVEEDPMPAFTQSGSLVVATFGGVLTSDDGCGYRYVPELEGEIVLDLARSASEPDSLVAFRLLGRGGGIYDSNVVRSDDAGASWTLFPLLPEELLPLTIDFAARDAARVYLTARRGEGDGFDSVLLVSDDGGETFQARGIPNTADQHLAYIAGVHPTNPDRLAVRVDDLEGTVLLETSDAGESFRIVAVGSGRLTGFAYSPDGGEVAFGGLDDGLWVGASDTDELERRSDVEPTCLGWNDDGLYACADAQRAGFSFGRSTDGGRSFESLLVFAELCGRSSCGGDTDVGALCPYDWLNVAPTLGATCDVDGGVTVPDAGDASIEPDPARPAARGGCAIGRAPGKSPGFFAMGALVVLAGWRRSDAGRARRSRR
jgi:hypothetical protein